jgi:hypothetical protein
MRQRRFVSALGFAVPLDPPPWSFGRGSCVGRILAERFRTNRSLTVRKAGDAGENRWLKALELGVYDLFHAMEHYRLTAIDSKRLNCRTKVQKPV